jgi:putative thioredoxin
VTTFEVTESEFMTKVVERSRELPVVVDFWAEWCAPCRQLGPALEAAVAKRAGKVELAKVDVDANQALSASFGVQGIPAVKAFRDGQVVAEFTGAIPPARIEAFLDGIVPSPADELAAAGDEDSLRQALALDPSHAGAATGLGRLLLARGEDEEALGLLDPLVGDFLAEGLAARARLAAANGNGAAPAEAGLERAFAAWDAGDFETALEQLQAAIAAEPDDDRRDLIRRAMVGIFTELGADHQLAREHRRRLAAALH